MDDNQFTELLGRIREIRQHLEASEVRDLLSAIATQLRDIDKELSGWRESGLRRGLSVGGWLRDPGVSRIEVGREFATFASHDLQAVDPVAGAATTGW